MKLSHLLFLSFCLLIFSPTNAQRLKPQFDKAEYIDLMKISAQFGGDEYRNKLPVPEKYQHQYRSQVMGLENMWELWVSDDQVAVISLRGTTEKSESWLANLYAAMVPATGSMKVSDDYTFEYSLAKSPAAAVHVGWLVSTAFLARDIIPKLDSCYKQGIKDMIIVGHSQGGAIAYLLSAYLWNLQEKSELPQDIQFKVYCSAAPKPGNLFFAYDYGAKTQFGYAYTVVNTADWVPEVPVTIQTLEDFSQPNPFTDISGVIKSQKKLKDKIALRYAYNKLYKPTKKAKKNYQKILGDITSKRVKELLPGFEAPAYDESNEYVRAGNTIVLLADEDYTKWISKAESNVFVHHFHPPYIFLAEKLKSDNQAP